jgi:outer membrane lipoprotein SlyB
VVAGIIVGAVVGGFLFSLIGAAPVTGLNIYSMVVAVIGAIVMLLVYDAIVSRRRIESLSVRTLACSRLTVDQMLSSIVTLPPLLQTGALALPKC